jgi:class 3 adenylate cyclase
MNAWIENAEGARFPLRGGFAIGRGEPNQLVLSDDRVSRRHALIQAQGEGEYWLVDLGSRNGTYLNGRRVQQPVRLADRDELQVGGAILCFRHPEGDSGRIGGSPSVSQLTLVDVRQATCWLLVADVIGSSDLMAGFAPEQSAVLMGHWLLRCTHLIEEAEGTVNKYLGDGFLAYWRADAVAQGALSRCLEVLRQMQRDGAPPFRLALHRGTVWLGGGPSFGEESLTGPDVNFVFRMEKLAAALEVEFIGSEAACTELAGARALSSLGSHALPGFAGEFRFFELAPDVQAAPEMNL